MLKFNEPQLCTLHELRTVYTLDDLYNFIEIIEMHVALLDQEQLEMEAKRKEAVNNRGGRR